MLVGVCHRTDAVDAPGPMRRAKDATLADPCAHLVGALDPTPTPPGRQAHRSRSPLRLRGASPAGLPRSSSADRRRARMRQQSRLARGSIAVRQPRETY